MHRFTKVTAEQVKDTRWLSFEDNDGNSITLFIHEPEQIQLMLEAADQVLEFFKEDIPRSY